MGGDKAHAGHSHCSRCGICADDSMLHQGYCPKCVRKIMKLMAKKKETLRRRKARKAVKPKTA